MAKKCFVCYVSISIFLLIAGCNPSSITALESTSASTATMQPTLTPHLVEDITPTSEVLEVSRFQFGNAHPVVIFTPHLSPFLADNKIGDMFSLYPLAHSDHPGYEDPANFAARIASHGIKWMRLSLDWFDAHEAVETGAYSSFEVHPQQDATVDALLEQGVAVNLALVYWDETLDMPVTPSRFADEPDIERFLDYIRFIVSHFKGRVKYYSLLNEPNIGEDTQQYVDPQDYVELVRRTVPVIRKIDPAAKIIIGEVTPLIWQNSIDYLDIILESDILPLVDGLSWHAAGWSSPEYMPEEYAAYQLLVPEIVKKARENGFQGEFWATENHWRTAKSAHPGEYDGYTDVTAAKYLARGIVWHHGQGFYVGLAENLEHSIKQPVIENLCTLLAGAEPLEIDISAAPVIEDLQVFSFQDPEGNILIVLWFDSIAQEDDVAFPTTLTIQRDGFSSIIGIDVLLSIQQNLVFSEGEDESTILGDILIRDTPLIILANP